MKYTKWLMLAGMAILLMTMGCEKQAGVIEDNVGAAATSTLPYQYNPGGSWFTYFRFLSPGPQVRDLSVGNDAGGNGYVTVWNDADYLYVKYSTMNGWFLAQVHVAVATDLDGIPHNGSGNMTPGKFPYPPKTEFNLDPYVTMHIVEIPWDEDWDDFTPPDSLYMVAHCIVGKEVAPGETIWQTGTGGGGDPFKRLYLPDYCIEMERIAYPFTDSNAYWQIGLSGITGAPYDPYNVWNSDQWKGWCVERELGLPTGYQFWVCLVDSRTLTPSSPERLWQNGNWSQVNWLLNNVGPGTDYENPPYDYVALQDVIHAILGQYTLPDESNPDPEVQKLWALYNEAMTHSDYVVPVGGWVAVLGEFCPDQDPPDVDTDTIQTVFIVVDP